MAGDDDDARRRLAPAAEAAEDGATRISSELTASSSSYPSQRLVASPTTVLPGEVLGDRYRVIERLGKGGMGEVYLAEHIAIGRKVAIKTLSGDFHERPELARRFLQEARTASKVRHPNIVDITDFGHTELGGPFFVMELLEGEDLKTRLRRERTLPWPEVVRITTQICAALTAAHAHGVVHRDMKPDNVFLIQQGDDEQIKVLDFGIAKITAGDEAGDATRTGVLLGTPHYMSPEQAQDDPLDARSDIYSLGVLLFRMVTGRLPFRGKSFMKVLGQHMTDAPPSPLEFAPEGTIGAAQERLILTCLAKRPEDR
ncbi:MAG: serine/threonine protein kinase, partial [Myxococcales bacterium]|nr:serine/threonine protein kinase [Myxococcales bacterium]